MEPAAARAVPASVQARSAPLQPPGVAIRKPTAVVTTTRETRRALVSSRRIAAVRMVEERSRKGATIGRAASSFNFGLGFILNLRDPMIARRTGSFHTL